jgi:hypothetical protein
MRVQDAVARAMAGLITWKEVENVLCCSSRHVRRLRAKCVIEDLEELQRRSRSKRKLEHEIRERLGDTLRDKRAGRVIGKRVKDDVIREILHLRQSRYFDFNLTHFHEKLREKHHISLSYSYIKRLLQTTGFAEKAPARGKHRRLRSRRPRVGMMLHIDGSTHAWLGPEMGKRDLIYILDDATTEALYGEFVPQESTRSCLFGLQHVLKTKGLFSELYNDRGSHFGHTPKAGGPVQEDNVQIARVLRGLRIGVIYAHSPQARGRSERAFRTVQGRLPQELREAGVDNWEDANRYLREVFIPDFNRKFTVEPLEAGSAFMPLVGIDIERACALEHEVTVYPDNTVHWRKRIFQIPKHPSRISFAKCRATLAEYLDGRIDIEYGPTTIAKFDAEGKSIETISSRKSAVGCGQR